MRVLLLFCHPVEDSYHAALHRTACSALERAGHEVDDCDLYAEGFCPVLSREERIGYHDIGSNCAPVRGYVERLLAAEALVLCFPVWNFGPPAMLKGFLDRVFLPGVSFHSRRAAGCAGAAPHPQARGDHQLRPPAARCLAAGRPAAQAGDPDAAGADPPGRAGALSRALPHERLDCGHARALPRPGRAGDGGLLSGSNRFPTAPRTARSDRSRRARSSRPGSPTAPPRRRSDPRRSSARRRAARAAPGAPPTIRAGSPRPSGSRDSRRA